MPYRACSILCLRQQLASLLMGCTAHTKTAEFMSLFWTVLLECSTEHSAHHVPRQVLSAVRCV